MIEAVAAPLLRRLRRQQPGGARMRAKFRDLLTRAPGGRPTFDIRRLGEIDLVDLPK